MDQRPLTPQWVLRGYQRAGHIQLSHVNTSLSAPARHPLSTYERLLTAFNRSHHQCLHPSIMQQVNALTPGHRIALIVSVTVIRTVLLVFYAMTHWMLHHWSQESPPLWQLQLQQPPNTPPTSTTTATNNASHWTSPPS